MGPISRHLSDCYSVCYDTFVRRAGEEVNMSNRRGWARLAARIGLLIGTLASVVLAGAANWPKVP
jgi:hypothetical protein